MLVVGLTGSLASGKSTVAKMFAKLGAKVLDADKIAKQLLWRNSPCFNKILRTFGKGILQGGRISRTKLASVVFGSKAKLKQLEKIIHPAVRKIFKQRMKRMGRSSICVLDVPLLFESGIYKDTDVTITVTAKHNQLIERAKKNLKLTNQEAKARLARQLPIKSKSARSDFTIDNSKNKHKTLKQVKTIWQKLNK